MKLKKTLSMLIGGICLVAATTIALAGPVTPCPNCGEAVPASAVSASSFYYQNEYHYIFIGSRKIRCNYTAKKKNYTYNCSHCGTHTYAQTYSTYDHSWCGRLAH